MEAWSGRYSDQNVLVTGGAGGIGFAAAARLAAEGATLGVVDNRAEATADAIKKLIDMGHTAYGYPVDITDPGQVHDAFDEFEAQTGKIDVLVNLAGIYPLIGFEDMTLQKWREIVAVNMDATFVTCHDVMPRMIKRGYGRISTVSSAAVYDGLPDRSAYVASKIGVVGLTRVLARHGGPHGITANAISPGLIDTEHLRELVGDRVDAAFAHITARQSIPRRGQPEDIADGIAWICSKAASFVTGQVIQIGGGEFFSM